MTRYGISALWKHKVIGTPSHMLLPYKFFTNNTSNIYLQCNWNLMLSQKHQNMYLWQDTAFPHSENTKWLAPPVACCCLTTFSQKIHLIYICNVIGISCSVTNTRTCICDKIRYFHTVKTQSDGQPQLRAVALELFPKKYNTSNIYLQCNWNLMFSHKHQNMYLWQDTVFPHSENTKWWATTVTCCCLRTFPQKIHLIFICNVTGV
jgi:hypothetical protein